MIQIMDSILTISILEKMNNCGCVYMSNVEPSKYSLELTFSNGVKRYIIISADKKYLGYNVARGNFSYWYYLPNEFIGEWLIIS